MRLDKYLSDMGVASRSDVQKEKIFDQLTDKTDPSTLMEINDRYFSDYPLMLMELNQYDIVDEMREQL